MIVFNLDTGQRICKLSFSFLKISAILVRETKYMHILKTRRDILKCAVRTVFNSTESVLKQIINYIDLSPPKKKNYCGCIFVLYKTMTNSDK